MSYNKYIESENWKDKSANYLKSNKICKICHKHKATEVHHLSYKRMGEESEKDLLAVCERCHIGLHNLPPFIEDKKQIRKSLKIMDYFKKYPSIKTLVLNDVSREFYNHALMLDKSAEIADETSLFMQNILEMFYEDGLDKGVDIIEFTYASCIKYKIKASKNSRNNKKKMIDRTKKYENKKAEIINEKLDKIKYTEKEASASKVKNFCLDVLSNRKYLSNAMSYMNREFYDGSVYFHRIGIKTKEQFYKKILDDGFSNELFKALGGNYSELEDVNE